MTITHMKNMQTLSHLEKSDRVDSFLSYQDAKNVFSHLVSLFNSDIQDTNKVGSDFHYLWYSHGLMADYSQGSNGFQDIFKKAVNNGFDGFFEDFQNKCSLNKVRTIQDLKYLRGDTPWQGMVMGMMVEFLQNIENPNNQKDFGNKIQEFMGIYLSFSQDTSYLKSAIGSANGTYGQFHCFPDFLGAMKEIKQHYDFERSLPREKRESAIKYLHEVEKIREILTYNKRNFELTMPSNLTHVINFMLTNLKGVSIKLDDLTNSEKNISITGKSNQINLSAMSWRGTGNNGVNREDLKSSYRRSVEDGFEGFMEEYLETICHEFSRIGDQLHSIQHTFAAPSLLFSKMEKIARRIAEMDIANPVAMPNEIQEFNATASTLRVLPENSFLLPDDLDERIVVDDFISQLKQVKTKIKKIESDRDFDMPPILHMDITYVISALEKMIVKLDNANESKNPRTTNDGYTSHAKNGGLSIPRFHWGIQGNEYRDRLIGSFRNTVNNGYEGFFAEYCDRISEDFRKVTKILSEIKSPLAGPGLLFEKLMNMTKSISEMDINNPSQMVFEINDFNNTLSVLKGAGNGVFLLPEGYENKLKIKQMGALDGLEIDIGPGGDHPALTRDSEANRVQSTANDFNTWGSP